MGEDPTKARTDTPIGGKLRRCVQFRDKHRARPEVIRWIGHYLRRELARKSLFYWTAHTKGGALQTTRTQYKNSPSDIEDALYWLGRASSYESGDYDTGGRRAQSAFAVACAGIVSHEVSVLMAKTNQELERERQS